MTYQPLGARRANNPVTVRGTSVTGLLGVAFIILKLTGVIAWSWWWVLAPFWAPLAIAILVGAVFLALFAAAHSKPKRFSSAIHQGRKR